MELQIHPTPARSAKSMQPLSPQRAPDALFVAGDAFFTSRSGQFAILTARDRFRRLIQSANLWQPAG
jgi:hypothetical protein